MKYMWLILVVGMMWGGELSHQLASIPPSERDNIELTIYSSNTQIVPILEKASKEWNKGNYQTAIEMVSSIDDPFIINYNYKRPIEVSSVKWGNEVQVNESPWKARSVELLKAHSNENLFIVAKIDTGPVSNPRYFVKIYFSSDHGETWSVTSLFGISTDYTLYAVNSAEIDTNVYIAISISSASHNYIVLVRLNDSNGRYDSSFGINTIITPSGHVSNMVLEPNRYNNSYLYIYYINPYNELKYYYSYTPHTNWYEMNTGVSDASYGLDADYGYIPGSGHFIWISYIDTNYVLKALAHGSGTWDVHSLGAAEFRPTSIAMRGDTVIVFYCYQYSNRPGIRYKITYNDGASWLVGSLNLTNDTIFVSDVTPRGNEGWQVAYTTYYGHGPEIVHYIHRGYPGGTWDSPVVVSTHDAWASYKPAIEYLGNGLYGIAYIDDNFHIFFNRSDWVDVAEPPVSVVKPFGLKAIVNGKNVRLAFNLPTEGTAKLNLYNVSGALVKSYTVSARKGENSVAFAPQVNGVYIARLIFNGKSDIAKFVIVR